MRQGLPNAVDHVRSSVRAASGGRCPAGRPAFARRGAGSALRPRRHGLRRAERLFPSHGQARDVWAAERGQREAADTQRHRRVRRRIRDRCGRRDRGHRRLQAAGTVVIYLATEHFVRAPQWTWYILGYFFFAGLTGGSYAVATLLRLVGDPRDESAARIGFYASFVTLLVCPVLLIFGFFAAVSALESFVLDRRDRGTVGDPGRPLGGVLGLAINVIGGVFALFIASYTGVLLSVSNQPIWSDTWMLGGLFLASGLSGSAALIALLTRYRADAVFSLGRLHEADGYFSILELVLLVAFFITIIAAGTAGPTVPFLPLWLLALVGIGASLVAARGHMRIRGLPSGGSAVIARAGTDTLVVSILVLLGVLALRAAVIFSAQ